MHIKRLFTTVITTAVLTVACSKQGGEQPAPTAEPAPLGVRVEAVTHTRSVVTGTEFNNGDRIGIILHDVGSSTIYQGIEMPYEFRKPTTDAGVWIPTEPIGLLVQGDEASVLAYHPAQLPSGTTLSTDKKSLNVVLPTSLDFGDLNTSSNFESFYMKLRPADANTTEVFVCHDDVDLMTGVGTSVSTASGKTKESAIAMKHALSMVIVYIKRGIGVTYMPDVQQISIRNKVGGTSPLKQGSFGLVDNVFTPNSTDASYSRTMSGFPVDVVNYAMLVYPATMAATDAEMVLKTDVAEFTMQMPAKAWVSGRVNIYNVTISPNEAQISGVTLADWPQWSEKPFNLD